MDTIVSKKSEPQQNQIALNDDASCLRLQETNKYAIHMERNLRLINNIEILYSQTQAFQKQSKDIFNQIQQVVLLTPRIKQSGETANTQQISNQFNEFINILGEFTFEIEYSNHIKSELNSLCSRIADYQKNILNSINNKLGTGQYNLNQKIYQIFQKEKSELENKLELLKKRIESKIKLLQDFTLRNKTQDIQSNIISAIIDYKQTDQEKDKFNKHLSNIQSKQEEIQSQQEIFDTKSLEIRIIKSQINGYKAKKQNIEKKVKEMDQQKNKIFLELEQLKGDEQKKFQALIKAAEIRIRSLKDQICELEVEQQNIKNDMVQIQTRQKDELTVEIQKLSVEQTSFYRIFILDESGSMSGAPFNFAIQGIKEIISNLQKVDDCEDSFCLIQFDSKARVVMNKQKIKSIQLSEIPTMMRGGGTDFGQAFELLSQMVDLCEFNEKPQVIFLTDGDSQSNNYLDILRQIKQKHNQKGVPMFCLGYGAEINTASLKQCLQVMNKSETYIELRNGSKISTFYQANQPHEIVESFKKITQSSQLNQFQLDYKKKSLEKLNQDYLRNMKQQHEDNIEVITQKLKNEEQKLLILQQNALSQIYEEGEQKDILENKIDEKEYNFSQSIDNLEKLMKEGEEKIIQLKKEKQNKKNEIEQSESQLKYLKNSDDTFSSPERQKQRKADMENILKDSGFQSLEKFQDFQTNFQEPRKFVSELIEYYHKAKDYLDQQFSLIGLLEQNIKEYEQTYSQVIQPSIEQLKERFKVFLELSSSSLSTNLVEQIIQKANPYFLQQIKEKQEEKHFSSIHKDFLTNELILDLTARLQEVQKLNTIAKVQGTDNEGNNIIVEKILKVQDMAKQLLKDRFFQTFKGNSSVQEKFNELEKNLYENKQQLKMIENDAFKRKQEYLSEFQEELKILKETFVEELKGTENEEDRMYLKKQYDEEKNEKENDKNEKLKEIQVETDYNIKQQKEEITEIDNQIKLAKKEIQKNVEQEFLATHDTTYNFIIQILNIIKLSIDDLDSYYNKFVTQGPLIQIMGICLNGAEICQGNLKLLM